MLDADEAAREIEFLTLAAQCSIIGNAERWKVRRRSPEEAGSIPVVLLRRPMTTQWSEIRLIRTKPDGAKRVRTELSIPTDVARAISELVQRGRHRNVAECLGVAFERYEKALNPPTKIEIDPVYEERWTEHVETMRAHMERHPEGPVDVPCGSEEDFEALKSKCAEAGLDVSRMRYMP